MNKRGSYPVSCKRENIAPFRSVDLKIEGLLDLDL